MTCIKTLNRLALGNVLIYGLMLLPTLILLVASGGDGAVFSRWIEDTWNARFWTIPGLGAKTTSIVGDILLFALIGLAGWLFYRGYRVLDELKPETDEARKALAWRIFIAAALFADVLLMLVPFHSSDLYGYINRGVQQVFYQVNPYQITVSGLPGREHDPMLHAHWIENPCPYPFFFARLAQGLVMLGGQNFLLTFLWFKATAWLAFLGTALLVYNLARVLGQEKPWLALYLFAWNPLMLLHVVGNGHNDILLVFFLLAALRVLMSQKWAWLGLPLLTLSVLIKYASVLAVPFVLVYLWRQKQRKALWLGIVCSLGLGLALALPYVLSMTSVPASAMMENAGRAQHSVIAAISRLVYYASLPFTAQAKDLMQLAQSSLKILFLLGFAGFYLMRFKAFLRQDNDLKAVVFESALAIAVLVMLVSAKFHSWYIVMFYPLVLLLEEANPLRRFGILLSLFHLAAFTPLQNLHVFNVILLTLAPLYLVWKNKDGWLFRRPAEIPV